MKNANLRMAEKGFLIGLVILICISNITAFAVSSDYWSQYPLRMNPGETKEFPLIIQNLVGTSDLRIKAVVTTGSDVLKLAESQEVYTVPAGEKLNVNLVASVPADAEPGQVYPVRVGFSEVTDSSSGEFRLGTAIGQSFDIVIFPGESAELNRTALLYIVVGVILLAIIIVLILIILRKKRLKGKSKRGK